MLKRLLMFSVILAVAITFIPMTSFGATTENTGKSYTLDLVGFMNWMTDTKELSNLQKKDLKSALSIINEAEAESFTKWAGGDKVHFSDDRSDKIIDRSDVNDAAVLRQMPVSIAIMKRINVLRQEDENYAQLGMKDGRTNFYIMSIAAAGAMRGAGLRRHSSLRASCENLSWSTTNAADNWYYGEKSRFDAIKTTLGITTITGLDQIRAIEEYADNNSITIGHYTNLFWSAEQAMGVGYTPYLRTACFNATKASNYSSYALYTIDEFEALMKEFCKDVGTHDFDEGTAVTEATCTEPGIARCTCQICGEESETKVPAKGHSWSTEFTTDIEPTCTKEGSKSKHCVNCDATKDSMVIPATGHKYGEWITTKKATCTKAGAKEKVCSVCGNKVTEAIESLGHNWNKEYNVDKKATCTKEGSESIHCAVCDAVKSGSARAIDKLPHSYGDWTITEEPTCTEDGSKERMCSICNYVDTGVVKANGHTWNKKYTTDKEATCTEEGAESIHCFVCDAIKTGSARVVPTTEHPWNSEYTVDKAATYTEEGLESIHCSVCDAVKDGSLQVVPKLEKKENTMTVETVKKTIKAKKLRKKARTVTPIAVEEAQGTVSYKLAGGDAKSKKAMRLNEKNGKITVKKGTKAGKYKIKVRVKAVGTDEYKAASKTVNAAVIVK